MLTYEYLHTVLNTENHYKCIEVNGCNIYMTSFHGWPFVVAIENENYILVMAADSCSEWLPEFKNTSLISVGKDGIATWDTLEMSVVVTLNSSEFEPLEKEEWVQGEIFKEEAENFAFPNLLYLGPQMYQLPFTGNESVKGVPVKRGESQVKLNLTGKRFYGFPMINGAIYWMPILSRSTN